MAYVEPGIAVFITGVALSAFSTLVVGLRLYCRYDRTRNIQLFDYLMVGAVLVTWGNTVLNYYQVTFGKGIHFPDLVTPKRPQVEHAIFGTLLTWYLYRMTYPLALLLTKFSILFFYRTLGASRKFRLATTITLCFVGIYTLAMILAGAFQCRRPSDAWSITGYLAWVAPPSRFGGRRGRGGGNRKCFDPTVLWASFAGLNLFTDVVIVLLPIPVLLGLRLPLGKRLGLIGIFSLGFLAIVASSLRLWILTLWAESVASQQRYGVDLLLWGQVEVNCGIVSASIPFLKKLFGWALGPASTSDDETPGEERVWRQPESRSKAGSDKNKKMGKKLCNLSLSSMGRPETEEGELGWKPFITVPQSLSDKGSRTDSVGDFELAELGKLKDMT